MNFMKITMHHRYVREGAIALSCIALGAGAVFLLKYDFCPRYDFINKRAVCGQESVLNKAGYIQLENDLKMLILKEKTAGTVEEVGVYFRDLRNGPIFGINEDHRFIPASLLKLPLVLTLFSIKEDKTDLLDKQLLYSASSIGNLSIPDEIAVSPDLQEGKRYALEQIMASTLKYSDNLAYYMLVEYLNSSVPGGGQAILRTFQEIGIVDPRDINEAAMSARSYASIFRLLYNASYLDPVDSELLLSWLAQTTFKDGLYAGIPREVTVAHKFGIRHDQNGGIDLHDCGIVYYPGNPYILCVMTHGHDEQKLTSFIATVSKMVYDEVHSRRK